MVNLYIFYLLNSVLFSVFEMFIHFMFAFFIICHVFVLTYCCNKTKKSQFVINKVYFMLFSHRVPARLEQFRCTHVSRPMWTPTRHPINRSFPPDWHVCGAIERCIIYQQPITVKEGGTNSRPVCSDSEALANTEKKKSHHFANPSDGGGSAEGKKSDCKLAAYLQN